MIFAPFRLLVAGVIIGVVLICLSDDYVVVSRKKYQKLKQKASLAD